MALHQAFRRGQVRTTGIGGEVRHGVTSGVSSETSMNKYVTPHLHRECILLITTSLAGAAAHDAVGAQEERRVQAAEALEVVLGFRVWGFWGFWSFRVLGFRVQEERRVQTAEALEVILGETG